MASWADKIPSFNPYIQQLPIEAMVAVGMEKQKRYDEGVQRIQSEIDQVAGLAIDRPQDKQHLQSKLDELGSRLKTVAAGDFSNYQLVNSVSGMTGQVARDEKVINSVKSTAQRRQVMTRMQSDIEKGNVNPANEYIFNVSDSEWFNDPNVGAKYTGDYSTPIDVWSKVKDIAKEVGIDEKTVQQLFETDSLGRTKYNADGSPVWNNIMVEKTFKGKDASKILKAFESALTPADYKQLSIEGRYKYRGVDSEQLEQVIVASADQKMQFNNGKIEMLKLALSDETNKTTKDVELIKSINDQIEFFQNQNVNFKTSKENGIKNAYSNPESVKASLFTDNYLSTMSQALSSQDVSTKYSISPMFEVSMKISDFNLKAKQWQAEQLLREKANLRAEETHKYDIAEKQQKLLATTIDPVTGIPQGLKDVDRSTIVAKSQVDLEDRTAVVNDLNYKIALESLKDTNPRQPGENDIAYDRRLRVKLQEVAKVVNPSSGSINDAVASIASGKLAQWSNDPDATPATMRGVVKNQSDALRELVAYQATLKSSREQADQLAITQGIDVDAQKKAMASIKPMTINLSGGRTKTLTAEDLIDLVNANPGVKTTNDWASLFNFSGSFFTSKEEEKTKQQADQRLMNKFGNDLSQVMSQVYVKDPSRATLSIPVQQLQNVADIIRSSSAKEYNKIYGDVLIENGALVQSMRYAVPQGELKDADYRNKINLTLQNYQSEFPEEMQSALSSVMEGKFAASIEVEPGTSNSANRYLLQLTSENGESSPPIEIGETEYSSLTGNRPPVPSVVTGMQRKLYTDGSTNLGNKGDYNTSYFTATSFAKFSSDKYSLKGDFESDMSDPNKAFFKLYLIDKSGNFVDETWMKSNGTPVEFNLLNDDGTPNVQIIDTPSGFNKTNVGMFFNRTID